LDNSKNIKKKEQKWALLIVWSIFSVATTLIILLPFFVDRGTVLQITPTCISKSQFNIECSLCGMTRAFIEISDGNYSKAYDLNGGSILVYISFLLNSTIFIVYGFFQINRKSLWMFK